LLKRAALASSFCVRFFGLTLVSLSSMSGDASRRYEVRMALAGEGAAVADVVHEVYDEYGFIWEADGYHSDLYQLGAAYLEPGDAFFVAVDCETSKLVGTAALVRFSQLPAGDGLRMVEETVRVAGADCSLERLYVRKAARRAGLGRVLMQRTIDFAQMHGAHCMEIWSDKRFVEAHRLYQTFGAIVVGERICDDPDESPEWGLKLQLAP
jgi:putative acetyltransferase